MGLKQLGRLEQADRRPLRSREVCMSREDTQRLELWQWTLSKGKSQLREGPASVEDKALPRSQAQTTAANVRSSTLVKSRALSQHHC